MPKSLDHNRVNEIGRKNLPKPKTSNILPVTATTVSPPKTTESPPKAQKAPNTNKTNMSETKSPKKAASSTKQNLFQKAKTFFKGYRAPRYLIVGSIAFVTVTLILSSFALWSANQSKDTAKAASTTFSNGNVTIDKKYVTAGVESDTASVVQGGTTTVRLRYTNSGETSITDATIKDTIPANFNYVPGTFKNCLNPTATELACDTLTPANKDVAFGSLTTPANGLSPAAGLYDAASVANTAGGTAPASTSGLLGIGKKRYLTYEAIGYTDISNTYSCSLYHSLTGGVNPFGNISLTDNRGGCIALNSFDSLGTRYLTYESATWASSHTGQSGCSVYAGGLSPGGVNPFGNTILTQNIGGCGARKSWDSLGARYLTYETIGFTAPLAPDGCAVYVSGLTQGGNNPFGNILLDQYLGGCGARKSWDTLDTTRSSGYIEYQLQSANTTPVGTYGTNVTLNGTGITGGLSDGLFSTVAPLAGITIASTPAPSISSTKLYSTDGINWSPTVTALTGQQVFVRLLRDNSGTASASDVNQKDTIPTPFTYVAGSFKNCLSPSITNISDATPNVTELACDTLAANKDAALTKLTSASGISPIAGLYDAADTTANGTAISSATGLMEIGKKRYTYQVECGINVGTTWTDNRTFGNGNTATVPTVTTICPGGGSTPWANQGDVTGGATKTGSYTVFDNLGSRYTYQVECGINVGTTWTDNRTFGNGNTATVPTVTTICPGGGSTPWANQGDVTGGATKTGSYTVFDNLGSRYTYQVECGINVGTTWTDNRTFGNGNTATVPTVTTICPGGGSTPWANQGDVTGGATKTGSYTVFDNLGSRYTYQVECGINVGTTWTDNRTFGNGNTATVPTVTTICPGGGSTPWANQGDVTGGATKTGSYTVFDSLDSTRAQAFIEYKITTPTNATAGNYGTVSTLASTNASNTFSQTSGVAGSGINLVYPDLTPGEIGGLVVTCNGGSSVTLGVPTTCTFPLTNKSLPLGFKLGIGDSTPFGNCVLNAAVVTCTGVPTGGVAGPNKPIRAQIGNEAIKTTIGTVTVVAASTDTLYIDPSKVTFSPIESAAVKFGSADLTLTVGGTGKDDPRFTANSTTATCKFRLKEYGVLDSDTTSKGFDLSSAKLGATVAGIPGGSFNTGTKIFEVPYSTTTGCSVKLPLGTAQNQPKWLFEIRVVRSDGQVFGSANAYFQTYGAIGGVAVS